MRALRLFTITLLIACSASLSADDIDDPLYLDDIGDPLYLDDIGDPLYLDDIGDPLYLDDIPMVGTPTTDDSEFQADVQPAEDIDDYSLQAGVPLTEEGDDYSTTDDAELQNDVQPAEESHDYPFQTDGPLTEESDDYSTTDDVEFQTDIQPAEENEGYPFQTDEPLTEEHDEYSASDDVELQPDVQSAEENDNSLAQVVTPAVEESDDSQPFIDDSARPDTGNGVKSGPGGWDITGYLVGTINSKSRVKGWLTDEVALKFSAGEGLFFNNSTNATRSHQGLKASLPYNIIDDSSDREQWKSIKISTRTVVMQYHRKSAEKDSDYILTQILEPPYPHFTDTDSYQKYPGGIVNSPYHWSYFYSYPEIALYGKVIDVSRTNYIWNNNECEILLHKGGLTDQATSEPQNANQSNSSIGQSVNSRVPDTVKLKTYSEDICRYAENVAITMTDVQIEYTATFEPGSAEFNPVIHVIIAQPTEK